ncbi:DUF6415 family natural product biosynthesis protein [Streptomyces megasporus]|uniref:DUF6415 family natural product biosynthesis protein n=1 Tax=Streptomyces megasporus TaxID=44060 RepID=UPI0004E1EA34|nr:DUF6415 family natural product biosynthesis protein [Streptomyces megasporus]
MHTTPDATPTTVRASDDGPAGPVDTTGSIDTAAVRHAIRRALAHGSASPRHEDLVELGELLRGHIRLLLPIARARVEAMPPAATERLRRRTRLAWIDNQVGCDLGDELPSARRQVRSLALDCRWLLRQLPGRDRKATP